jgi:phytoene dehydrogenase-like protein
MINEWLQLHTLLFSSLTPSHTDTDQFKRTVSDWQGRQWVSEWTGSFAGDGDFFGLPAKPPFYVGTGGMNALPVALVASAEATGRCTVHRGTRVESMQVREGEREYSCMHLYHLYHVLQRRTESISNTEVCTSRTHE